MGRIRSLKPEFPQSETVGSLSRDARLLFLQLFTIVDDEGRARASPRMLASLLYPYDDDAAGLIDRWLNELEGAGCIRRYEAEGSHYLDLPNWRKHQKIDRPTPSRLPPFVEGSSNTRRGLATDLGSGRDMDRRGEDNTAREARDPPAKNSAKNSEAGWRADRTAEFEQIFWPRYPHKVGKKPALAAFLRVSKQVPLGRVMAGLERYCGTVTDPKFFLNPATFLNQNRFDDEPATSAAIEQPRPSSDPILRALARRVAKGDGQHRGQAGPDDGLFDQPGTAPASGAKIIEFQAQNDTGRPRGS